MAWIDRLRNVLGRRDVNDDIDEELQFHLDQRARDNVAAGMGEREARRDAVRRFGNQAAVREQTRDADILVTLDSVVQDLGFALRSLRKHPTFSIVAILTLALGIGANTAIFAVVYNVLLRPLPFDAADRLFVASYQPTNSPFWLYPSLSDGNYLAFREADRIFEATASFAPTPVTLTGAGDAVRLAAATVTPDFFRVLRVNTTAGRTLIAEDAAPGQERVVVVGHDLWRSRFGASSTLVGQTIALDGVAHRVVGIAPAGFTYPAETALWTPLQIKNEPGMSFSRPVIGRLRPEMTPSQAEAAWQTFAAGLPVESREEWSARLIPLKDAIVGDVRTPLLIFLGAVGFVLLIACANVSNLLLMRTVSRQREIATRLALGAGRGRVARQLVTETLVLALAGGLAAMQVTLLTMPALLALIPARQLPRYSEIHLDGWVLSFTLGLTILTGLVLGLTAAFHGTRVGIRTAWRDATAWSTRRPDRLRHGLVVAEVALAVVLLAGAGLLVRSLARLTSVDPGFQPANVIAMTVDLPASRYSTPAQMNAFHDQLLGALAALPGSVATGAVNWMPFGNMLLRGDVQLEGGRRVPDRYVVTKAISSPGYLSAMGIRLVRGRDFTWDDGPAAPGAAIVSESVARRLWPGEDALGQRISLASRPTESDWLTVVGIASDVRQGGLKDRFVPAVYQPYAQVSRPNFLSHMTFVIRTDGDPRRLAPMLRARLREADASLAPQSLAAMDDVIARSVAEPRFQTRLLAIFSALALVLAAIGVYGMLASSVAERQREIGIRIAMGAPGPALVRMIVKRVLLLTAAGLAIGIPSARMLNRYLTRMLFQIEPTDPATFAGTAALLVAVALAASLVPARRAARVDPLVVLRAE